ncbi:hypothetical protein AAMO2058_000887300 [Amorphochlora amoebiformis]
MNILAEILTLHLSFTGSTKKVVLFLFRGKGDGRERAYGNVEAAKYISKEETNEIITRERAQRHDRLRASAVMAVLPMITIWMVLVMVVHYAELSPRTLLFLICMIALLICASVYIITRKDLRLKANHNTL